jgi:1,2-phenylacetyl-CoA epoxidase catalytic subunit
MTSYRLEVLNQVPVRGQHAAHVATALNEAGALAVPYTARRNDHMDSLATGLAVSEFAPDGIAAAEIRALWAWSKRKLTRAVPAERPAPELAWAATATKWNCQSVDWRDECQYSHLQLSRRQPIN